MVSITKIDPSEIPEVSHKFLMRGRRSRSGDRDDDKSKDRDKGFGWSKKSIPQSRSGRTIKGRGNFRYRTPSRSRSRSRSNTPEHWKAAQRNVIKITDFERMEEQKKTREAEMSRRADERKKRHDALTKGDGKKSFFELAQEVPETVLTIASSLTRPEKSGSVDLNALDYEESDSDREVRENIKTIDEKNDNNGRKAGIGKPRSEKSHSRSRGSINRRSRSRDNFNKDRRDYRPAQRNRFNDNNRRWDNDRAVQRNRSGNDRWSHSKNRESRTKSRSRSRSR